MPPKINEKLLHKHSSAENKKTNKQTTPPKNIKTQKPTGFQDQTNKTKTKTL